MRIKFLIVLLLLSFAVSAQFFPSTSHVYRAPKTFAELTTMSLTRHGNPIIPYGKVWDLRQVHFPSVLVDPHNHNQLLKFYGGGSVLALNYSIGRATANVNDPYTWTEYASNPVLNATNYTGLSFVVGPDLVFWDEQTSKFYLYTQTYSDNNNYFEGLFFSTDGFTWTYYGAVLTPSGDETVCGGVGILHEGSTWYMYYTYRTASAVLPGIRLATSTDRGLTWTKTGTQILSVGASYDNSHIEGLQALHIGNKYVLNYGCSFLRSSDGLDEYCCALAYSDSPTGPFTKWSGNPFFTRSTSGLDNTQVSTATFCIVTDPWILYYQGTNNSGDYGMALWSMFAATLNAGANR